MQIVGECDVLSTDPVISFRLFSEPEFAAQFCEVLIEDTVLFIDLGHSITDTYLQYNKMLLRIPFM